MDYIPSDVDIWGALVKPYDMGEKCSNFFSTYLGTECKLAYVNLKRPRFIQGPLPPDYAQKGKHPETGLSDGAPFLFGLALVVTDGVESVLKKVWKISTREWRNRCPSLDFGPILYCVEGNRLTRIVGLRLR
jgi:hypothetical protein